MIDIAQKLRGVDWDFSDYSSVKYPFDLNSIPWYPATFAPPIPKFLIASLTKPGDVVLDPFGGSGTTVVEALKLSRLPIYNDLNPFAADIVKAILCAIRYAIYDCEYLTKEAEQKKVEDSCSQKTVASEFIDANGINKDVHEWFHEDTLVELLGINKLIQEDTAPEYNDEIKAIRKFAFSSILKSACSQPGHFTYITDNCKPKNKTYKNAISLYVEKIEQICLAAKDMLIQFRLAYPQADLLSLVDNTRVEDGDARDLSWIGDHSVDLVLTSPPYLCAQDYIKTMRLTNLFFTNDDAFINKPYNEIGSRKQRKGKPDVVVPEFYQDLRQVFTHVDRVLKPAGYFCLVMGQGKSKITTGVDTISDLCGMVEKDFGFEKIFHEKRNIVNREIRIGGVDKEDIIIFQKKR